ncbi:MAG TPA: hypothetical protein PK156_50250 [Polyangium sp.]|nr:hypothetical protein [Polyangium sp.]
MNSNVQDLPTSCWYCNKRPATTTYTNRKGTRNELVCASCLDLLHLQEDFGWGIYDNRELDEEERYDELLAWVDQFEEANRHRDHTGWLARNAAAHRALIYWQAERYEESLAACDQVEQFGFDNVWQRWLAGSARAQALEGLDRHAEALAAFEAAFRYQDPGELGSARYFIKPLAEFSANAGKPVDERWREVVQNVADEYEVEFPERPTLGESILALFQLTEGKPSKREREQAASRKTP